MGTNISGDIRNVQTISESTYPQMLIMSEIFGKNLTYLRDLKSLKQSEMPELTGVSRATWSDYERGKTEPDFKTLLIISEFFGVDTDSLLKVDLARNETNVHLTNSGNSGKKGKKVHPNVHPSVHPNPQKGQKMPDPEKNYTLEEPIEPYTRGDGKIVDALIMSIKALDAVNTKLMADLSQLEDENKRLKKDLPQIGKKMDNSDTKTA